MLKSEALISMGNKMKLKLLIITLALTACTSVLAAEGHGYKILREEIHAAPGSNYHVIHRPLNAQMKKKNQ